MSPQSPVLDVLIARDGKAWRLYFAPGSWCPGILGAVHTSASTRPSTRWASRTSTTLTGSQ